MIAFQQVSFSYGQQPILSDISFQVEKGETLSIIGLSGSGKSTILKLMNRLLIPIEGEVLWDGTPVTLFPKETYRQNIGYVIQQNGLFPHWSVEKNVGLVPKLKKYSVRQVREKVEQMLAMVNLPFEAYRHRYPSSLSGGQEQRVGIARALAGDPDLLLLDEPFSALDPITRHHLQQEFVQMKSQWGKTIIFVTHDIREAFLLADRVLVLDEGKVVQWDTPEKIRQQPANLFVEQLLASAYV